jgi:hypothetical protein
MKKNSHVLIFLLLAAFVLQVNINAQEFKKYYQKSGKLEQKLSGAASGSQTIYWDDFGNKELTESEMNMMGMSMKQSSLILGKDMYTWSSTEPNVYHIKDDITEEFEKRNFTADDFARLSEEMMKQSGFEKKGNETIMGKNCTIWENTEGIKVWTWKNLTLQMLVNAMGMNIKYETVSLDLNTDILGSVFEFPKDKTLQEKEPDEKAQAEKQKTIEILNNMSKTGN